MKKAIIIETERLILKPLGLANLSYDYLSWLNHPEVSKYIISADNYTFKKLENFLKDVEKKIPLIDMIFKNFFNLLFVI